MSKGLDIGFIGFLIAGQFVSVVYYPFMWIYLALVVATKKIYLDSDAALLRENADEDKAISAT